MKTPVLTQKDQLAILAALSNPSAFRRSLDSMLRYTRATGQQPDVLIVHRSLEGIAAHVLKRCAWGGERAPHLAVYFDELPVVDGKLCFVSMHNDLGLFMRIPEGSRA